MDQTQTRGTTGIGAGHVAAAAIAAFVAYILIGGLEATGRHFVELGALRIVLVGALFAFAQASGAIGRRLGRAGLWIAGFAAVAYVAGALGAVATDGWSFDIFHHSVEGDDPPWYAYVIGLAGLVFALGAILVGTAGRSGGRLAWVVIVGGALWFAVFPVDALFGPAVSHTMWLVPWMALAVGLIRTPGQVGSPVARAATAR